MFGKGRRPKDANSSIIVKSVDVSLLMDSKRGDRFVELDGQCVDGGKFHLLISEGLALEMAELFKQYLT